MAPGADAPGAPGACGPIIMPGMLGIPPGIPPIPGMVGIPMGGIPGAPGPPGPPGASLGAPPDVGTMAFIAKLRKGPCPRHPTAGRQDQAGTFKHGQLASWSIELSHVLTRAKPARSLVTFNVILRSSALTGDVSASFLIHDAEACPRLALDLGVEVLMASKGL